MLCHPKLRRRKALSNKRNQRSGVVTVEFALCLPLLALICFGSIQVSNTILLRHKSVTTLEIGTLDFMLGNVAQEDLKTHIEDLSTNFEMVDVVATVTEEVINGNNYLRVELNVPISQNITSPNFVQAAPDLTTSILVYRP